MQTCNHFEKHSGLQGFAFLAVKLQRFAYFLRFLVILATHDSIGVPTGKRKLDVFYSELVTSARRAEPQTEMQPQHESSVSQSQPLLTHQEQ